jgi:hypothetical protein
VANLPESFGIGFEIGDPDLAKGPVRLRQNMNDSDSSWFSSDGRRAIDAYRIVSKWNILESLVTSAALGSLGTGLDHRILPKRTHLDSAPP